MITPLTIAITSTGALIVQRQIRAIGAAAVQAAHDVDLLTAAASILAAGAGFKKFADELNSLQEMRNQLANVTSSTEELTQAQDALLRVAKETRTPFEDTVQVFARVKRATQELGVSSAEAIRIVKTLNEALVIGGASGQERRSTIYQFTQALASGRLGGDELRSLLENAPVLTRAIADHMGVSIGQLRALGKAGKLTTRELVEALRDYAKGADEAFGKTTPTIQQALSVLRISVDEALLSFDRAYDISGKLSRALLSLGDNAQTFAKLAIPGILGLSSAFIVARLAGTTLTSVFTGLIGVLALNPFTAVILALGALALLIYNFRNDLTLANNGLTSLADVGLAVWEKISNGAMAFYRAVNEFALPIIKEFVSEMETVAGPVLGLLNPIQDWFKNLDFSSFANSLYTVANVVDEIIDMNHGMDQALRAIWKNMVNSLAQTFNSTFGALFNYLQTQINQLIGVYNNINSKLPKWLQSGGIDSLKFNPLLKTDDNLPSAADAFKAEQGKSTVATGFVAELIQRAQQIRNDRPLEKDAPNALGQAGGALNQQNIPGKPDAKTSRLITQEVNGEVEALKRAVNAYNSVARQADVVGAANDELQVSEAKLTEAVNEGVITNERKNKIMETLRFTLRDNLDPQKELIDNLQQEIKFSKMSNDNREIQNQLLKEETRLREKGVVFTRKDEYEKDLVQLKDFQRQSQELEQTMTGIFNRLGDVIADFVRTGKLDFAGLIDSIIADIIRLVVQETIVQPLLKAFDISPSVGGGGGGGGSGIFGSILNSIFGGGSGGGGGAFGGFDAGVPDLGSSLIDSFTSSIPGFANGGSFDTGGSGGTDSQLVAFKATPGEHVSVGQDNSATNVVIYDQRTASGSQPVQARQTVDGNGRKQLELFIRDTVNKGLSDGSHDNTLAQNYGVTRNGGRR